jgi:hypothetical protein
MLRRNFLKSIGLLTVAPVASVPAFAEGKTATGKTVIKGKVTGQGKGIANVVVTDGYQFTKTGADGQYSLTAHDQAEFVYISLPAGYAIPNEKGVARFYETINRNAASQTIDFALQKLSQADDKHAFILWGDTQILDKEDAQKLITTAAPDTRDVVKAFGNLPVFGIGCGDLVFDHLELFEDYKKAVEITGAPFFQVIGNHDMDLQARTDDMSQQSFKGQFGPTYFSFNRGKIHYVILDDVFFLGAGAGYTGYITETQLSWLEKDLQFVPKGSTVIVSLHIPTCDAERGKKKEKPEKGSGVANRNGLYKLLEPYKAHILSGHTHFNENWEEGNMMEHNHGTVCGAWWSGPVCGDGTPCGYGVYEVDGENIKWYYKSTGLPKQNQVKLYRKGEFTERPDAVLANVFNWDAKWKVEWLEDGVTKGAMEQVKGFDPLAVQLYKGQEKPSRHAWVEPVETDHLFVAVPSAGAKKMQVKTTDRFGNVYEQEIFL